MDTTLPPARGARAVAPPRLDERRWLTGAVLDHTYLPEGLFYLVEDLSTLEGQEREHEFTEEEIRCFSQGASAQFRQEIISRSPPLENSRFHVKWAPFWAAAPDISQTDADKYWEKFHVIRREVGTAVQRTAPRYDVDLATCNPDFDVERGAADIR